MLVSTVDINVPSRKFHHTFVCMEESPSKEATPLDSKMKSGGLVSIPPTPSIYAPPPLVCSPASMKIWEPVRQVVLDGTTILTETFTMSDGSVNHWLRNCTPYPSLEDMEKEILEAFEPPEQQWFFSAVKSARFLKATGIEVSDEG